MALQSTSTKHEALYQEIAAVLKRHAANLSAAEILAITSNIVGKVLAMQDQRTMSSDRAMAIIADNIEEGNAQAVAEVSGKPAGSA